MAIRARFGIVPLALGTIALITWVTAGNSANNEGSIESLTNDRARLKVVLQQCKDAPESMPQRRCQAAAKAWRRRFFATRRANRGPAQDVLGTPRS